MRRFLAAITIVIPIGLTITQELGAQARPDTVVKSAVRYYPNHYLGKDSVTDSKFVVKDRPSFVMKDPETLIAKEAVIVPRGDDGRCDWSAVRPKRQPAPGKESSFYGEQHQETCKGVFFLVAIPKEYQVGAPPRKPSPGTQVDTTVKRTPAPIIKSSYGRGREQPERVVIKPAVIYRYPGQGKGTFQTDTARPPSTARRLDSNTVTIIRGKERSAASFRRADSILVVDVIRKNFGDRKHTIDRVVVFGDSAAVQASMATGPMSVTRISYMLDRRKNDGLWLKRDREDIAILHYGPAKRQMPAGKKDTVRAP